MDINKPKSVTTSYMSDYNDDSDAFHRGVDTLIKTVDENRFPGPISRPRGLNRYTPSYSYTDGFMTSSTEEVDHKPEVIPFASEVVDKPKQKRSIGLLSLVMNSSLNGNTVPESNFHQDIGQRPSSSLSGTPDQTKHVLSGQEILNQNGSDNIDLKSLSFDFEATHELSNRPKIREIYNSVTGNLEGIKERLACLSILEENLSTDQAIEIADAAYLLKILGRSEENIELAGKMAHNGSLLMLQANIIIEKGHQLFAQSKRLLQLADLMPCIIPMDHKNHGHSRNRSI